MENNNQNALSILTFVGVVAILVLGLMGKFAGISQADIDAAVKAAAPAPTAAAPTPTPAPAEVTKVDLAELEAFYKTTVLDGKKDAPITIIEFSDVQCPFCQRQTNGGTLEAVMKKYEGKVNTTFAHFPLSFHPSAQKAGESLECAAKLGGDEAFLKFKKALFGKGVEPTLDVIKATATEQKLNADKLMECVNAGEFAQKVADQMAFGRKLGISGTPGNVVMNNKTGEFIKVSGAVPPQAFEPAIEQFLK